jgi:hypothetical protein
VHPGAFGAELNVRDAARVGGVSKSTAARWLAAGRTLDDVPAPPTSEHHRVITKGEGLEPWDTSCGSGFCSVCSLPRWPLSIAF